MSDVHGNQTTDFRRILNSTRTTVNLSKATWRLTAQLILHPGFTHFNSHPYAGVLLVQGRTAEVDPLLPDVLVFAPGVDLHDHPLVRDGCLILQVTFVTPVELSLYSL